MKCPECGGKTKVVETRSNGQCTIRRRICQSCKIKLYTEERYNESAKFELSQLTKEAGIKCRMRKERKVSKGV